MQADPKIENARGIGDCTAQVSFWATQMCIFCFFAPSASQVSHCLSYIIRTIAELAGLACQSSAYMIKIAARNLLTSTICVRACVRACVCVCVCVCVQAGKPLVLNVVRKAEALLLQDPTLNKVCECAYAYAYACM
jgi:hypothetical protein